MSTRTPRVDAYIRKSAAFAKPILAYLRGVVHEGCPEIVEEIKWGSPHFAYKGMFCGMAAFKEHCVFGFWKHSLVVPEDGGKSKEAMGSFGCIRSMEDLPSKSTLMKYIRKAKRLNDEGVKAVRQKTGPRKPIPMPPELKRALAANAPARQAYEGMSPSHRREYDEWIGEAKGDDTRERRIATTLEWLAEGKSRNWKYERKTAPRGVSSNP